MLTYWGLWYYLKVENALIETSLFGVSLVHLKSVISYCFGFHEVAWFPPCTRRGTLPWREISQPHAVYAANLCVVGTNRPASRACRCHEKGGLLEGSQGRMLRWHQPYFPSSVFCSIRPKEWGLVSAEPSLQNLALSFPLYTLQVQDLCVFDDTRFAMSLTPLGSPLKRALYFVVMPIIG